jgi:hypothetical protein
MESSLFFFLGIMAQLAPESATFSSLDKKIIGLTDLVEHIKEVLFQTRSATIPPFIYEGIQQLEMALTPANESKKMQHLGRS